MEQTLSSVRSQSVPLAGLRLLLPNTCIAEVVTLQPLDPVDDAPEWLLGTMDWRGERIPVISFEIANELDAAEITKTTRITIINGISGRPDIPFYGIISSGIPRLLTVDRDSLLKNPKPEQELSLALEYALLDNETCVIPNQDAIETLLLAQELGLNPQNQM
ncbi:MAG: chemotaxis protein CheW [Gammaproteobacteria bacterium]|nr:chemotaxis protein CheW [Gammaproteobacteria bacterium]